MVEIELQAIDNTMRRSKKADSDIERILKCHVNGKCKGYDLTKECKKFRKFVKDNSQYRPLATHTASMMSLYTAKGVNR